MLPTLTNNKYLSPIITLVCRVQVKLLHLIPIALVCRVQVKVRLIPIALVCRAQVKVRLIRIGVVRRVQVKVLINFHSNHFHPNGPGCTSPFCGRLCRVRFFARPIDAIYFCGRLRAIFCPTNRRDLSFANDCVRSFDQST